MLVQEVYENTAPLEQLIDECVSGERIVTKTIYDRLVSETISIDDWRIIGAYMATRRMFEYVLNNMYGAIKMYTEFQYSHPSNIDGAYDRIIYNLIEKYRKDNPRRRNAIKVSSVAIIEELGLTDYNAKYTPPLVEFIMKREFWQ